MLVKSFTDDLAWQVQRQLVKSYFKAKELAASKPSGMEVVDIPENVKMQEAMQEVRKQLNAMDVIVQEYNQYQCRESYIHLENVLSNLWLSLGRKVTYLMEIEPNLTIKKC